MKALFAGLALPLLAMTMPVAVQAQAAAGSESNANLRQQLAREIVENGFPQDTRMDLFGGVMQQLINQMNVAQPQLQDDPEAMEVVHRFQQRAIDLGMATLADHMDSLMEGLALAYADIYTYAELKAFHAFITSPEGHGFLAKSSAAAGHPAFAAANQVYMNEYMAKLPELQAELRDALIDLMASREAAAGNS